MKGIITIIIIIVIITVGFLMLRDGTQTSNPTEKTVTQEQLVGDNATEDSPDVFIEVGDATDSIDTTGEIIVVTYNKDGFSPKEINISKGQTVRFVNESQGNMWVGSAMHPDHMVYSGTSLKDHCPDTSGTAFDQCESGDMYEFTFTKTGQLGYHNHMNPSDFGKVIVK